MLHSKRFCKCTHSHNKCCYHYKSQNIFLFQKNNIHKLSSHYKSISLRMSIIPNFDWCARRDSPSRVGKTVHWTLFCSSFSSHLFCFFRLVCQKGLAEPRRENRPLDAFLVLLFESPFLFFLGWCARRDSNPLPLP